MPPKWDNDERERPNWRDIDRRKDRSRHATPQRQPRRGRKAEAEWIRIQALKKAEALFAGKRGRPEYQKALRSLEAHRGTPKFEATAKKFLAEYGMPEDWSTLMLFLDYSDPEVVKEVLNCLQAQVRSRSRVEQQGLQGKLRTMSLTTKNLELKLAAEAIIAEI
ncbi:MAG: hypothetical protein JRI57_09340 [Deltaproteobacteria bacterium]|nr:hypothetical protein [Deltaproteobacteria bacterium]MBW1953405.1 hypothetical protein [Deltaproteobacteria bacterium]MBW1987607.1 hypothetical protein [Deltaproteobacteria bacterium]MBW2135633.1 hypothetical protein [Deltaproteobacteria bacterium]